MTNNVFIVCMLQFIAVYVILGTYSFRNICICYQSAGYRSSMDLVMKRSLSGSSLRFECVFIQNFKAQVALDIN